MLKKVLFFMLIFGVVISPVVMADMLEEANTNFTYEGKPIHPGLVHEFSNWLSDGVSPIVVSVDLISAFNTNKYPQDEVKKRENWRYVEKEEMHGNIRVYESFYYRWLGKMADGTHVVETGESGGGSGFFMDLMFIRFSEGEIMVENEKRPQLLMSIVGIYLLGDRYDGEIIVHPDRVFIPASKNQFGGGSTEKDVELSF
jgi:hypothetical protein